MNILKQIRISGFKCFEDQSINFNKLTVFAGANSVGKSTAIQSLLLCRSSINSLNEEVKNQKSTSNLVQKVLLNGDYCLSLGNSKLIENTKSDHISFSLSFLNGDNYLFDFINDSTQFLQFVILKEIAVNSANKDVLSKTNIGNDSFHYLNAERIGPRLSYDVSSQSYPDCGWKGEYATQILAEIGYTFKVKPEKMFPDTQNDNLLFQATKWLNFIIPDVDIDSKIYEEVNKGRTLYNKNIPYNVGFGISYILPIIVDGLISGDNSLFIVENPEAHLHPLGQSNIGQFLAQMANSGAQTVVETHSEHVINGIRIASLKEKIDHSNTLVNFISKVNDKTIVEEITITKLGDLSHWPKGFLDQSQSDFAQMISLKRK